MTLSPIRRMESLSLRLLCALLTVELAFPAHSFALRAPQIKDDSPALSGLEESLGSDPEAPDPKFLALEWKEFLRTSEKMFRGFHGTWWSTVLGGGHVPLIRLFEQLEGLTPSIAEERYDDLRADLSVRIHTVEEIQAEVSRALAKVREPEKQELLLKLAAGTAAGYRRGLEEFRKALVSWRDKFQNLAAGLSAPLTAGLEEGTAGWRGDGVEQWRAFGGTTAFQLLRFLEWRRDRLRVARLEGNGNGEAPDGVGWFSREQAERLLREAPEQFLLVDNRHRQLGLLGRSSGELYHELRSRSLSNIVVVPLTQELITRHKERFEYLLGQLGLWVGGRVEWSLRDHDLKAEYSFAAMDPLTQEILGFISASRGDARRERPDSSSVYVGWNVVDKARRGSGVGRLLLEAVLRAAHQVPEIKRVYLDSLTRSETQRFYGTLGAQRVRTTKGILDSSDNRVRYQFILRTPEEVQAQMKQAGPSAELGAGGSTPLTTGLEEVADGAQQDLDQQAFQELEALLRNPGVPRRVPVSVEEVTPGGARVVYRGEGGGTTRGFLPVGTTFLDDEHFVSIEAKLTWLRQRARLAEPLEVFPEGIGHSRRDDAPPLVIFRLDRLVGPDLFEEEPVFHDQIIAGNEAGRIRLFLSWLAERGSEPTERLVQMYYLGAWGRLQPGQAAEVVEWLAKNVQPRQGRPLFLLFQDVVVSSQTTSRGRREWLKTQEEALRGIAAAGPFAGPKAEVLEAIQGLWTLVDRAWPEETKPGALGHLQYAAQRLGTNQALAWLRLVSPDGQGAGLEEVKRFESVEAFLEAYREDLRATRKLPLVETIRQEKKKLPVEVLVVPAQAVVPQIIYVYVMAEDASDPAAWEVAVQERLNRERDRLQQTLFLARPFPADGRIEGGSPAVVIRQAGAILPVPEKALRFPVVTLSIVNEVEQLHPSWLYALAVNRNLEGLRLGPVLEVIPVEDGFAVFV